MANLEIIENRQKRKSPIPPPQERVCHYRNLFTKDRPNFIRENNNENDKLNLSLTRKELITEEWLSAL